jgi:hypothetical protein
MLFGSKSSIGIDSSKTSTDASVDLVNTSGGVPGEGPMGSLRALACGMRADVVLVLAVLSDSSTMILTDDEVLDLWI